MTAEKLKKVIFTTVFFATMVIVALVLTMIILFVIRANLENKKTLLEREIERTEQQIESIEDEIEYRKSDDYVKKYWLENGYNEEGATQFVPSN